MKDADRLGEFAETVLFTSRYGDVYSFIRQTDNSGVVFSEDYITDKYDDYVFELLPKSMDDEAVANEVEQALYSCTFGAIKGLKPGLRTGAGMFRNISAQIIRLYCMENPGVEDAILGRGTIGEAFQYCVGTSDDTDRPLMEVVTSSSAFSEMLEFAE